MSTSLSVECDPVEQPAATDPIERRTWCALRMRIGGRTVTRTWDKALAEERAFLYVPAFPIAQWLVSNWWVLLHEPIRSDTLPAPAIARTHLPWIKRHCLRSSESGMLLPALYFYNDGRGIRAEWQADERDALAHMPAEFVDSGSDHLELNALADVLGRFISEVLGRTEGLSDERVDALQAEWQAIQTVDAEEAEFCVVAGRMGIDPYDREQMPDALASFIEASPTNPEIPWVRDLTEVAEITSVEGQWAWVRSVSTALNLGPMPKPPPSPLPALGTSPFRYGYQLAGSVRRLARLEPGEPVSVLKTITQAVANAPLRTEERNHLPGNGVRAVVGWADSGGVLFVGPRPARPDNERFLLARGLYHALFACQRSERLVTDAYTWDQQASRAFAAELLAPRSALLARVGEQADRSQVEALAAEFQASTLLIERQLENAGIGLLDH